MRYIWLLLTGAIFLFDVEKFYIIFTPLSEVSCSGALDLVFNVIWEKVKSIPLSSPIDAEIEDYSFLKFVCNKIKILCCQM